MNLTKFKKLCIKENVKKEKIIEAILILARCIDNLELPYTDEARHRKLFVSRENLVKDILKTYD